MKLRKVVDLIRGHKGTKVKLTVIPAGVTDGSVRKEITIVRDVVKLNSARARAAIYQVPGTNGETVPMGVITLPSFYGLSDDEALPLRRRWPSQPFIPRRSRNRPISCCAPVVITDANGRNTTR